MEKATYLVSYPVSDLQLAILSYSDQSTCNYKSEGEDEEMAVDGTETPFMFEESPSSECFVLLSWVRI
jgi:hypothetical protein